MSRNERAYYIVTDANDTVVISRREQGMGVDVIDGDTGRAIYLYLTERDIEEISDAIHEAQAEGSAE